MNGEMFEIDLGGSTLQSSRPLQDLLALTSLQLANNFGPLEMGERARLEECLLPALRLVSRCFRQVNNGYYSQDGVPRFKVLHSGNYCLYLHFLTRTVYEAQGGESDLCDKLFYLNRIMHGVDLFYGAGLPDVFYVEHPLGSCMGRAAYSDYLLFHQGCTVGGRRGEHPTLGERVVLFAGAKILGRSTIGPRTALSAQACVVNQDVPGDCLVFGSSPHLVFKPLPENFFAQYFHPA